MRAQRMLHSSNASLTAARSAGRGSLRTWLATTALATTCLSACYHYVPVPAAEPGAQVRTRLTPLGADSVVRFFGPGVSELTGTLLGAEQDSINLLVSGYTSEQLGEQAVWNQAVSLVPAGIGELQQRKLHTGRTIVFAAGLAASASLAFVALDLGARLFENEGETDPGPTDARSRRGGYSVLLRVPMRIPVR